MKRFLMYIFMLIVLMLLTQGCMSSQGKKYYQLHTKSSEFSPKTTKVLMVEKVDTNSIYSDYRVVYRLSPFELNYYSYEFWIKKPGQLIQDAITDYYTGTGAFSTVITRFAEGTPHMLLKTKLNVIEEFDSYDGWFAHLDMEIIISDFKSEKIILRHAFDRKKKLLKKKVGNLPLVISEILEEELKKVLEKLAGNLKLET